MATHDIIVIGASAGGIDALKRLVGQLPADLPAAIFITVHISAHSRSYMPDILARAGSLPVVHPDDGSPIEYGRIYVAPPNRHLLIERGHVHLSGGPKENRHRPAINPLFRSAALAYGPRVIGVILTGTLDDGTAGLWEIKRRGGITVVEDPNTALYGEMPQSALVNVDVDFVVELAELPALLTTLAGRESEKAIGVSNDMQTKLTRLTCPDCNGPIEEFQAGAMPEFKCRVGHSYSPASMVAAHAEWLERALWAAVLALEEGAELAENFSERLPGDGKQWQREARTKQAMADRLKQMIAELNGATASGESDQ